jgi:hypothetical protein
VREAFQPYIYLLHDGRVCRPCQAQELDRRNNPELM